MNDREGIIETALNRKTFTDPDYPEAIRQLMQIFIDRVEVFEGGYGTIHYDLPARSPVRVKLREPLAHQGCYAGHMGRRFHGPSKTSFTVVTDHFPRTGGVTLRIGNRIQVGVRCTMVIRGVEDGVQLLQVGGTNQTVAIGSVLAVGCLGGGAARGTCHDQKGSG